ncbi:MAG: peptidoglycan-associated lipoprotein Pal [Nitrospirae bacterium]|nr:peptidoglycan-associated lipoprotein Pal [Nitrospirota bacterium]
MQFEHRLGYVAVVAGLILLLAPGCSKKAIQGETGAQSSEQSVVTPSTPATQEPAPLAQVPAPSLSGSGAEPLTGFEPVKPGAAPTEERVGSEIQVAKAAPTDTGPRVEEMQKEQLAAASAGLKDVFFEFDSFKISEEAKEALARDAEWLKVNPSKPLAIEGHCDERGTQAYNLVLGEKRAKAVRSYLVELGVKASRLTVVSYGKERPFCKEHDESCYQQNRRGHLILRTQ